MMSVGHVHGRLQIPDSLREQLAAFRARVWSRKTAQGLCIAAFGVLAAYLVLFGLDRAIDSPGGVRLGLFALASLSLLAVPIALYRWVWRNRRADQLARLLTRTHPHIGDRLLGIIELVRDGSEQARSLRLCEAAIVQVAEDARKRDFSDAVPSPRHRLWAVLAAVPAIAAVALAVAVPAAASNAWARLVSPWGGPPRYTFAALAPLPSRLVVPHGEPFTLTARLAEGSEWKPEAGTVRLGSRRPVSASLRGGSYEFAMPAQIEPGSLELKIGDASRTVRVEPTHRPELASVVAEVRLPEYLERPSPLAKDVRGGSATLVRGSRATFRAVAGRELSASWIDGQPIAPIGATIPGPTLVIDGPRKVEFRWKDAFGLEGKEPFSVAIAARDDEAPTLVVEDLPRQKVLLDIEQLAFRVRAQDDFGVKRAGIEWQGADDGSVKSPAQGEMVLGAGGPEKDSLDLAGVFAAKTLGIEPQAVQVRAWVEDYLPGRERVYSSPHTFFVLNAEQHAIWLTEQMSKWHRQSLEVRDREMQLHEANKQIRAMTPEEIDRPEARKKLEAQALAEGNNGRRLSGLVNSGEDLIKQAMRNPEIGVGHLEKWGEALQILKDISANRMPSVADLLKQSAQAPSLAQLSPKGKAPMAGQVKGGQPPLPGDATKPGEKPKPSAPTVADRESQLQDYNKGFKPEEPGQAKAKSSALRLPVTTLGGKAAKTPPKPDDPAEESLEEAVVEQKELLEEFEKLADEMNKVLANLEGSTLVKRLKAQSRQQDKIAGRIQGVVDTAFGMPGAAGKAAEGLSEAASLETKGSLVVSVIMDDMQSFLERRQMQRIKTVLDDMRKQDVIGALRQLGDDLSKENGVSIAQAEYWSDTLDRWAEDLVDPSASGKCPGGKSRASLPPSVVLEILQVLEAEINLREETRVAEQAKPALPAEDHSRTGLRLSGTQEVLKTRIDKVNERIRGLPDSEAEFGKEMALLAAVSRVMDDAREILGKPETGSPAIAAETEAIELLLQSKRINPRGGGGGGASPGAGGGGTTTDSALALVGKGLNAKEVREDRGVSQATGDSGPALPEEFRSGLDEYFNKIDRRPGGR